LDGKVPARSVAARVVVDVDGAAFPVFANPDTSANEALEVGAGLNWYWNKAVKISTAYTHTSFDGGATNGDRDDEDIVFTRVQLAF
jgi:phosphate-selective porin OprO/OprP